MDDCDNLVWIFLGVYGYLEEHNKRKTWRLIEEESRSLGDNLICFRDLDDNLFKHEKMGSIGRSVSQFS